MTLPARKRMGVAGGIDGPLVLWVEWPKRRAPRWSETELLVLRRNRNAPAWALAAMLPGRSARAVQHKRETVQVDREASPIFYFPTGKSPRNAKRS